MSPRPKILIVDDEDQTPVALELRLNQLDATWRFPTAVTDDDLRDVTLIVVDQYIDYDRAPDDDLVLTSEMPDALVPWDGLALAAVFRSAAEKAGRTEPLPVALRSGNLDQLTQGLPRAIRQTIMAATHDLEWVLNKADPDGKGLVEVGPTGPRTIAALARALIDFPSSKGRPTIEQCARWLLPNDEPAWSSRAAKQIEQCRPPTNTALQQAHGLSWLRWLGHHCLPFPTFLTNDIRTATDLGITVASFRHVLDEDGVFGQRLRDAQYQGPLAGLHQRRFWRAAVNELINELVAAHEVDDPHIVGNRIAEADHNAQPLGLMDPVVCIDTDFYDIEQPVERDQAERLAPDYWPAYADAAFARIDALRGDPDLQALRAPRLRP